MIRKVHKYLVLAQEQFTLDLPKGAQILTAQAQNNETAQLWALVDPEAPVETRSFQVYPTGHPIPNADDLRYINTFQFSGGALVFHLFEKTRADA